MSIKRKLVHAAHVINKNSGGAKSTKAARLRHLEEFIAFCNENMLGLIDFRSVTKEMLVTYSNSLASPDRTPRNSTATIHNKLASIRAALKSHGVNLKALAIQKNADLDLGQRSRLGTKQPITDEIFESAIVKAVAIGETGFAHCIRLERFLGLRGLEAIMATAALKTYAHEANQMIGRSLKEIEIYDGTKGGRPRQTAVIQKYAEQTLSIIIEALKYSAANGGYLIRGKKLGLKEARARYHKIAQSVGLVGTFAPHSLRYRYVCDKLQELRDLGVPRQEALVLAAKWLGHGAGRGRWVSMVYGRSVMHTYNKTTRLNSQRQALSQIFDIFDSKHTDSSNKSN